MPQPNRALITFSILTAATLAIPLSTAFAFLAEEADTDWIAEEACLHGRLERTEVATAAAEWDESTGRDLRNFAPDRVVDSLHMKLELRFDDLNAMRFEATETLRIEPIAKPTKSLTFDAVGLDISSVTINGETLEHFIDDDSITLRFDPALEPGTEYDLIFEYVCDHPLDGMFFTPASPDAPDYTAEVHTQGETITNRHWFIAHDSPNERMTTELIVDVPAEFSVSSNGRLIEMKSITESGGDRGVWHYLQDKPHVSYLVSLVIGKFDIVEIPHDRVPMQVWAPKGRGGDVMQTYGRTGEMIDLFERRFGVPYPWARYDQLILKNFGAGGMENTSVTSMHPTAILDETALLDADEEGLIAHELAHQWAGDLLTCKEWAHIWLNEGFATYGAALWQEEKNGENGYLDYIRGRMGVARRDQTTGTIPMVSPIYDNPGETFRRPGNPYPKGASILHMLRRMLSEDVFWEGIHLYMNRHAYEVVETHDLRYAMEEVSGLGLEWFFDQWCFRPGCPALDVDLKYHGANRELVATIKQTQQIDARTPAFRFTLPIYAKTASGEHIFNVEVTDTETVYRTTLDGSPVRIAVDPYLHVLCTMEVTKPSDLWLAQLKDGPTIVGRSRAIEMIGRTDAAAHRDLLATIVRDANEKDSLRSSAARELSGFESAQARELLLTLIEERPADAKVRVDLIRMIDSFDKDKAVPLLVDIASNDESYACRAAAISALGELEAKDQADLIVDLAGFPSHADRVRNAALRTLAEFDDPRGLDLAIKYAAYGYMDRARPTAIGVIADLAKHDQDKAIDTLLDLLNDPESRAAGAAGRALAEIGDERAREPIERIANSHRDPDRRDNARRWLETLRENIKKNEKKPS